MSARTLPRVGAALALAVLLGLTAGCRDSSDPVGDPSTSGSPDPTEPTTASTTSSDPTLTDSGQAAATGPLLEVEAASVRAPQGYRRTPQSLPLARTAYDPATGDQVIVSFVPFDPATLDALVESTQRFGTWKGTPRRLPDVSIAGQEWYHLVGAGLGHHQAHEFGTYHDGDYVKLVYASLRGTVGAPSLDAVLASVVLR